MKPKKITIQDIAETANVSKSTVSRVLNDSTPVHEDKKKAVLAAMKKLKFQPNIFAQGLAGGQSMAVGVITQDLGSPFYDHVAQGIITGLHDTRYSPIIADGQWNQSTEAKMIDALLARQVDGLIIVGGVMEKSSLEDIRSRLPLILVGRRIDGWENHCIAIDNVKSAYMATKHLIDSGHRRIVHIKGIATHRDAIERFEGYKRALKDNDVEFDPNLVVGGNFRGQSGLEAVESLSKSKQEFTAIFAANDEMAFGARLGLYRLGIKVPQDVSVVGFDDQPNSALVTPPLTTIRQPATEMGIEAAKALIAIISDNAYEIPNMETELVQRESVKKV